MKKLPLHSLFIISVVILFSFSGCNRIKKEIALKRELEKAAQQVNDMCPMEIEEDVVVNSCEVVGTRALRFYYTTGWYDVEILNGSDFERIQKPFILQQILNNDKLQILKDNKIGFRFLYQNSEGEVFGEISLNPKDYNSSTIIDKNVNVYETLADEDINLLLRSITSQENKKTPIDLGDGFWIVNYAVEGKMLIYTYLLDEDADVDYDSFDEIKSNTLDDADQEMMDMISAGITMRFIYKDEDDNVVYSFDIDSSDLE